MAGGKGTRMAPYTQVLPKPLVPVDGAPILEIILRQLGERGFNRITICVGYLGDLIRAYFGDGSRLGLEIDFRSETEPLGTAGPLKQVSGVDEPILVVNGDIFTDLNFRELHDDHLRSGADMTVAAC